MPYLTGFGSHHASEAIAGALPIGRNSPQRVPFGLYAEQLSGTAFTAPRHENLRSWLYRMRPSAMHGSYVPYTGPALANDRSADVPASPNRLRWDPLPLPQVPTDFVDGLVTYAGNGDPAAGNGSAIYLYATNRSMVDRAFFSADGELLIVPQEGSLRIVTEMGVLDVAPLSIAVIPRGLRFRVELVDGTARGYVCENYGAAFRLPDLGPRQSA
jgi:homogentisate 1,2-dioxygenase